MYKLKLSKFHWAKFISILFFILLLGAYADIFAIANPYNAGETLDPNCLPGEVNCTVLINGDTSPITVVNTSNLFATGLSAGTGVTATTYSNFFGTDAGDSAAGASYSNFLGPSAGSGATFASDSNFFGRSAGSGASYAYISNFLGAQAGFQATNASYSNFIGFDAGYSATNASYSNFIGNYAGSSATNALSSNFLGQYAGSGALNASYSNLFGYNAGRYLIPSGNGNIGSNNIIIGTNISLANATANAMNLGGVLFAKNTYGTTTGYPSVTAVADGSIGIGVTPANISARLHLPAGTATAGTAPLKFTSGTNLTTPEEGAVEWDGTNIYVTQTSGPTRKTVAYTTDVPAASPITIVNSSNLFSTGLTGTGSGVMATTYSNFFGTDAGDSATGAYESNFIGHSAGASATSAYNSNFIGQNAGSGATSAFDSNFIGHGAGSNADGAALSNFIGSFAGDGATSAIHSNFLGYSSGWRAVNAFYSNFIGSSAGSNASNASFSNFLGPSAGYGATSASYSNFFGNGTGYIATSASNSNFFGNGAGSGATSASSSNFFGQFAGDSASSAQSSNFFGASAGASATNAYNSNFFGPGAGQSATGASSSNFLGYYAGNAATNASLSNIFGYQTGRTFTSNNIGSNNIIIGTNISLPDATANAMNLGGVIFATDTYSTTSGDPSITPATSGKVGIGVVSPTARLEVQGLVTNASLGTEKVYNPNFDSDDSGWTATGWSWGSAKENYTGTTGAIATVANRGIAMNDGGTGYTNGDVLTLNNGANDATITVSSVSYGKITGWTLSNAGTANTVTASVAVTGGTGTGAAFGILRLVDSTNTLSQDVTVSNGNSYLVSYVVTRTAGELKLTLGGVTGHRVIASGTYSQAISATGTGNLIFTPTVDFSGSIDIVSVTQITPSQATTSLTNSNGSAGLELRSGGTGLFNTFVGYHSGYSNTTGSKNTANGMYSLNSNTTGWYNTANGNNSLYSNTTGSYNTANGNNSLYSNTTGSYNTANGMYSLNSNTTGSYNTANGMYSLNSNTTGWFNTANGYNSLSSNTTGSSNTASGYLSLSSNTTGSNNTASGYLSLSSNTTGSYNTASGYLSLSSNTTGSSNTASGSGSLYLNTTGSQNTANGMYSLHSNITGNGNTANGNSALYKNTIGSLNTASGVESLYHNTTGSGNTASGDYSLYNSGKTLTAGSFITGISYTIITAGDTVWTDIGAANNNVGTVFTATGAGSGTGTAASSTNNNTAFGYQAGRYAGSGTTANNASYNSLYLGYDIRASADGNNNEIVIGYGTIGNGTNTATIGSTNVLYVGGNTISGKVARFTNSNGYCDINPATTSLDCSSDITLKKNITNLDNVEFSLSTVPEMANATTLDKILSLTPVTFNWNTEEDIVSKHIGFIAQEMEQVFPELVQTDSITLLKTLSYTNLTPYLVKAIQEMDLKMKNINELDLPNTWRDSLLAWFKNTSNGITEFVAGILRAKDQLCIGEGTDEVCITKEELLQMKSNTNLGAAVIPTFPTEDTSGTLEIDSSASEDTPNTSDSNPTITDDTTSTATGGVGTGTSDEVTPPTTEAGISDKTETVVDVNTDSTIVN